MDALYFASDTLHMELHVVGKDVYGKAEKFFDIGPFQMSAEMEAFSDVIEGTKASFFVKITPRLWLYMTVSAKDGESYVYVVDGQKAELNETTVKNFKSNHGYETALTLKAAGAVKAVFQYKEPNWVRILSKELDEHTDLGQGITEQSLQ